MKTGRRLIVVFGLSVALQAAVGGSAGAQGFADCILDAAANDLAAKTEFQRGLRDVIVQKHPEFEQLAAANMALQLRLAESRPPMFGYLLAHDPGRIDTANGLGQFRNFDWTEQDTAAISAESASYRDLRAQIAILKEQNNGHPDWTEMRAYFRADLRQSAEFKALLARFQEQERKLDTAVGQCRQ